MGRINRIINIRFELDGLHFDAAVDPDWQLHFYDGFSGEEKLSVEQKESETPIEVYCFDKPEWDILMLYQTKEEAKSNGPVNEQQDKVKNKSIDFLLHTACNFDKIIEETKKWIKDNKD